jgi:hypothetical protein
MEYRAFTLRSPVVNDILDFRINGIIKLKET